jgi:hypothetical protein
LRRIHPHDNVIATTTTGAAAMRNDDLHLPEALFGALLAAALLVAAFVSVPASAADAPPAQAASAPAR